MIRQFVIEMSKEYTNAMKNTLEPSYYDTILELSTSNMVNANNWLQSNLSELSFYETQNIGKEIASYAEIITFLRESNNGYTDIDSKSKCEKLISDIYDKYEYKFRGEFSDKNNQEQMEYIQYILVPIYCIYIFLNDEIKKA